jgi:hypothetical protein
MTNLHDERLNRSLTEDERSGLSRLQFNNTLPGEMANFNHQSKTLLSRYISQALQNNMRLPYDWVQMARSMRTSGRIPDDQLTTDNLDAADNTPPVKRVPSPNPTASPSPNATPTARDFDLDVSHMTGPEIEKAIQGKHGIRVKDRNGTWTLN